MIRAYLGFDLTEYRDPKMMKGILYGSIGACADALPWFLTVFSLPYIFTGGDGCLVATIALGFGIGIFLVGILAKKRL